VKAHILDGRSVREDEIVGRILVHDIGPDLRKGAVLARDHLQRVRQAGSVHVVELEPGDVHEDEAARRLAEALLSPNLETRPPVQSQARLIAV